MKQGWSLIRLTLATIFGNLGLMVRVCLLPIALFVLVASVAVAVTGGTPLGLLDGSADLSAPWMLPLLASTGMFAFCWMSVGWHRNFLADEFPKLAPDWSRAFKQLIMSVLLGAIMTIVVVPLTYGARLLGAPLVAGSGPLFEIGTTVFALFFGALLLWVSYRLMLVLPAVSVDRRLGFSQSWREMGLVAWPLFVVAVIVVGFSMVAGRVIDAAGGAVIGTVLFALVSWLFIVFGTTFVMIAYGHLIERRDLGAQSSEE